MKTLVPALALSLFATFAQAADIKDPNGLVNEVIAYLGKPDFDKDFKCGDKTSLNGAGKIAALRVQSLSLNQEIICDGDTKVLRTKNLTSSGILDGVVIDDQSVGDLFKNFQEADLPLDRDAYESDPKEYLMNSLNYLGDNEILIKSVKETKVSGPDEKKINAMIIEAVISIEDVNADVPGRFKKLNAKIYLSKEIPAIARIFKTEVSAMKVSFLSAASAKLEVTSIDSP